MPRFLPLPVLLLAVLPSGAVGYDFSVDPLSPEVIALRYGSSDVIQENGAGVHLAASSLGIGTDELDGFSYGKDILRPLGPNFYVSLQFSVSRETAGGGGVVTKQKSENGAAGDKFAMLILRSGRTVGPFLESDAPDHGLTKLPPSQSSIDGLSYPPGSKRNVFYTVGRGGAKAPSDVYFVAEPGVTPPVLYASASQLGLQASDNIDGLAVKDGGTVGALDAADVVYVSLDTQSPTRISSLLGSEGILQVWPLPVQLAIPYTKLDVSSAATEEIDAITAYDPGPAGLAILTELAFSQFALLMGDLNPTGLNEWSYYGILNDKGWAASIRPGLEVSEPLPLTLDLKWTFDSAWHVPKGILNSWERGTALIDTTTSQQSFHHFSWQQNGWLDTTVMQQGDLIPGTAIPMRQFNRCGETHVDDHLCFFATMRDALFNPYWSAICRHPGGSWTEGATFATQGMSVANQIMSLDSFDCAPNPAAPAVTHCFGTASSGAQRFLLKVEGRLELGVPTWGEPEIVLDSTTPAPGGGNFTDFGFQVAAQSAAFHGRTSLGGEGIYRFADGVVKRIADRTTPVPGGSGNFTSFGDDLSNDDGAVTLIGNSSGGRGIYSNLTGRLQKIVQVNDVIDGRTVSGVTLERDAASVNLVAFGARFSDGWASAVVKELPKPFDTTNSTTRVIEVDVELDPDPIILGPDPRALFLGDLGTARLQGRWTSDGTTGTIRIPGTEVSRLLGLQFGVTPAVAFPEWVITVDVATGAIPSSSAAGMLANGPFGFDADTVGGPWTSPLLGAIPGAQAGFETDAGERKLFCSDALSQLGGNACGAAPFGSPPPAAYDRKTGFSQQTGPLTLGDVVLWGFLGDQRWLEAPPGACPDGDSDGVCDALDNCTVVSNASQLDADADGFGNACDGDLDDNLVVNFSDLARMRLVFFKTDAKADLNGDGVVNFADLAILRVGFFKPPGPSALAP